MTKHIWDWIRLNYLSSDLIVSYQLQTNLTWDEIVETFKVETQKPNFEALDYFIGFSDSNIFILKEEDNIFSKRGLYTENSENKINISANFYLENQIINIDITVSYAHYSSGYLVIWKSFIFLFSILIICILIFSNIVSNDPKGSILVAFIPLVFNIICWFITYYNTNLAKHLFDYFYKTLKSKDSELRQV